MTPRAFTVTIDIDKAAELQEIWRSLSELG